MWRKGNPIQNRRPRTPGPPPEKIHIQTGRPRTPAGGENPHPNPLVLVLLVLVLLVLVLVLVLVLLSSPHGKAGSAGNKFMAYH